MDLVKVSSSILNIALGSLGTLPFVLHCFTPPPDGVASGKVYVSWHVSMVYGRVVFAKSLRIVIKKGKRTRWYILGIGVQLICWL